MAIRLWLVRAPAPRSPGLCPNEKRVGAAVMPGEVAHEDIDYVKEAIRASDQTN